MTQPLASPVMADRPSSAPALAARLGALLASPRARVLVPLAGVLLTLPSIAGGLVFDDVAIRARVLGRFGTSLADRLDVFAFFPADPVQRARLAEAGLVPWFAAPDSHIAFFRPLSAALHFVDYSLLARWPWLMHAESLALYAALIAVAAAFYRRLLPSGVAMLAALLYAIDDGHGIPVGWLANRNALVAALFGFAAVLFYDRGRRDGDRAAARLGPLAFALSLLAGEGGVACLAYLGAHAVTLDRAPLAQRARALAPYLVVVVVWQIVYRRLGYGAYGSGAYLDPIGAPRPFFAALPGRAVGLLVGLFAAPPAVTFTMATGAARTALVAAGAVVVAILLRAVAAHVRASPEARFFALGAVGSVAPAVAALCDDRLLVFAGLGAFGLVASVLGDLRAPPPRDAPPLFRGVRRAWIALHLVLAPLLLPFAAMVPPIMARVAAPPAPLVKDVAGETLVVANVPTALMVLPWLFPSDLSDAPPARARPLVATMGRVAWAREDARTVRVDLPPGAQPDPLFSLLRDPAHPLHEGDVFDVPGMRAEVFRVDRDHAPTGVRFRFDRDLDDPSLHWVAYDGTFRAIGPPKGR